MSVRVVDAVARETGIEPTELPPLHGAIGVDALDELYTSSGSPTDDVAVPTVTFTYAGHEVVVRSPADIEVHEHHGESDRSGGP